VYQIIHIEQPARGGVIVHAGGQANADVGCARQPSNGDV
jgi:hypothetical protein